MKKIIKIESARHMDDQYWAVGQDIGHGTGKFITEIKDLSTEYETGIHERYDIYVNGELFNCLVNMPVIIEYSLGDES